MFFLREQHAASLGTLSSPLSAMGKNIGVGQPIYSYLLLFMSLQLPVRSPMQLYIDLVSLYHIYPASPSSHTSNPHDTPFLPSTHTVPHKFLPLYYHSSCQLEEEQKRVGASVRAVFRQTGSPIASLYCQARMTGCLRIQLAFKGIVAWTVSHKICYRNSASFKLLPLTNSWNYLNWN